MSSFKTDPVVVIEGLKKWRVFVPYTYYRNPIYDEEGNVKDTEEYTEAEKEFRSWEKIVVPQGFVSNGTSIPRILWSIWPPHDYYVKAAILHDYLYNRGIGTRKEADKVFYEALKVLGTPTWLSKCFYWGVRLFGKKYSNHKDKR